MAAGGYPGEAKRWTALGYEKFTDHERTGDEDDIRTSVSLFRLALDEATRAGEPDLASYHNNLGYALHTLAELTGDPDVAADSVGCYRAAVSAATVGPDGDDRIPVLASLSSALRDQYKLRPDLALLTEAVAAAREAIRLGDGVPGLAQRFAILATGLGELYQHTAEVAPLAEAVTARRKAVELAAADDPIRPAHLNSLGATLHDLHERTGDLGALAESVRVGREAVAASSGDQYLSYLSNLANTLRLTFEETGDLDALAEAVGAARTAVAGTDRGSPDFARRSTHLCGALSCRYQRTADKAALAEAIAAGQDAVAAAPPGDEERAGYLSNLEQVLEDEWSRTGDVAVLQEAVRVAREAVAAAPDGHRLRSMCLTALSSAVGELYDRTGDTALLAESVQTSRAALAAVPAFGRDRPGPLHNLGMSLHAQFKRTGDLTVLEEAVRASREAVAATAADDPARPGRLDILSGLLQEVATRRRDVAMVQEAVQLARDAVAATAADDPAHASRLEGLGSVLNTLFEQTGNSQALAESVAARRAAVEATPDDGDGRFARQHNLALSLQNLAERTDDPLALVDARDSLEAVVAALPADHPDRAIGLHNLSQVDAAWYRRFGDVADLRRAVDGVRSAIAATPRDHPVLGSRLETLSRLLVTLADETGDPAVLDEALQTARAALAATARDVPDYAVQLVTLGLALWRQHGQTGQTGQPALIAEAWQCFYDAARYPVASANLRIGAYQRAAQVATAAGRTPQQALACIEAAVALLPQVTPADLARTDQEYRIGRMPHLAVHAATAAVAAGRPDRAVELLEQTRGVLAAAQLDYLTRHDHSRPLGIRDLAACAADGPIVYLYASVTRCDALILTPNPDPSAAVLVVPLADSEDEVWKQAGRLLELVGAEYGDTDPEQLYDRATQAQIISVLDWLRDAIVTPVLRALGHARPPRDQEAWPRVWWCPVGIFSYLPVHAVCLDEVVSSYVSTARALRYARIQPEPAEPDASRPLLVAVPDARGVPPLPGAAIEADEVARVFPGARRMPLPTRDRVIESLPDHPIAHFACHGANDRGDPGGASGLILYDYAERALTVPDISALRLPGGLAYLSVCETALTTLELANESVHIAGAFQLAGYQHVIGTLWSVLDRPAARVARDFYLRLTKGDTAGPDLGQTGQALHDATVALRAVFRDSPAVWAAYTHTGP